MFEQAFKNIDDVLHKEAGCTTELDYTEQTSWLLFLKYLDGLEPDRALEGKLHGKKYTHILDKPYRWETWAAPKGKDGKLDHNTALTGDDLCDFVDRKLFPYLQNFKIKAIGPDTIEYKIVGSAFLTLVASRLRTLSSIGPRWSSSAGSLIVSKRYGLRLNTSNPSISGSSSLLTS